MHSGVTVSHVTNEELYTALIQMQGLVEGRGSINALRLL